MARARTVNEGQRRSAPRKRALQQAKREALAAEAAQLGILPFELQARRAQEAKALQGNSVAMAELDDRIRSWGRSGYRW